VHGRPPNTRPLRLPSYSDVNGPTKHAAIAAGPCYSDADGRPFGLTTVQFPELMRSSTCPFVRALFAPSSRTSGGAGAGTGGAGGASGARTVSPGRRRGSKAGSALRVRPKGSSAVSVSSQFRESMSRLSETLSSTQCHFIRCIKPNDGRTPFNIVPAVTLAQLRSCGGERLT
jgi:myosin heavy subunit